VHLFVTSGHVTEMEVTPFDLLYTKTPAACKLRGCMFYRRELLLIRVLHCGNMGVRFFAPVTLLLTQ